MYGFWIRAERFYMTVLPSMLVVLSVATIIGLFMFYYTEKGSTKRRVMGTSLIILFLGSLVFSILQHHTYNHWVEQYSHINPGVRNQRKIMGAVVMEDSQLVSIYQGADLSERLGSLEMYESREVTEEINNRYLGEEQGLHYFAIGDDEEYTFWYGGNVQFIDGDSYMKGTQFQLNDSRFESLGFISATPYYLETIYVNKEEAEQATNDFPPRVLPFSSVTTEWITADRVSK